MKRILSVLLVLFVLITFSVGCGEGKGQQGDSTTQTLFRQMIAAAMWGIHPPV